jgi:hypothetical protein
MRRLTEPRGGGYGRVQRDVPRSGATDDSDFSKWFRARVLDVTGFDLAAPPEGPPPAVLVDWQA